MLYIIYGSLDGLDESPLRLGAGFGGPRHRKWLLWGLSSHIESAALPTLWAVQQSDGATSVGEVADALPVAPSTADTASRLVGDAAEAGTVNCRSWTESHRMVRLHLTAEVWRDLKEISARHMGLLMPLTAGRELEDAGKLVGWLSTLRAGLSQLVSSP